MRRLETAPHRKLLALVTGASSGIGAAFAGAYARRGADLVLVARRIDRLNALAATLSSEHGVTVRALQADLAAPDCAAMIAAALGGVEVDILVNNAGYSIAERFLDVSWEAQRDFIQVLATSPAALCRAFLPGMVARGYGRVVNVGSMSAFSPGAAGHTLYPAVKSFILKMSQSLAAEVKDKGVNVTAVCPGQTESEFADANGTRDALKRLKMKAQTAEDVVEEAVRANEAGREIVVTGLHNKLAVGAMKVLPDEWSAAVIRPIAARVSRAE